MPIIISYARVVLCFSCSRQTITLTSVLVWWHVSGGGTLFLTSPSQFYVKATNMPPRNLKATETDKLVLEAVDGVNSGKYKSGFEAARELGISRSTVCRRLRGNPSRSAAREKQQLLSEVQENTLVKWIKQLTIGGYPVTYALLREIANEIRSMNASPNFPNTKSFDHQKIGRDWVPRFIQRHPNLKAVVGRRIEISRMSGANTDAFNKWFDAVKMVVDRFDIEVENIYNMDETGFSMGTMDCTRVIVDTSVRTKWQAHPGRKEWVTIVECICADGTSILPLVIFKGVNPLSNWIPRALRDNWYFSANSKGWTTNLHGLEWLIRVFDPQTRDKAKGKRRLLICDGHDSHISGNFITYCMKENILVLILPPHTSHMLQPLDVAIFGPLKKGLTRALSPYHEAQLSNIQKAEWLEAYMEARKIGINATNIASAWRGAGLVPFDPKKALRYLAVERGDSPPPLPAGGMVRTPPESPTIAIFSKVFVNSSSPELGAYQVAMQELSNHLVVLKTPLRSYMTKYTRWSEKKSAALKIAKMETKNLLTILNKRKNITKGKRHILKGRHLVTTAEIRDEVVAAEKQTLERATKTRPKVRNHAVNIDINESEDEYLSAVEDDGTLNDCIIVSVE
jgi:DDE superfamily endonuclease/Tc5 transposase DNA-binding domain